MPMNKPAGSAMSYDELRGAIAQRHRALSGRLQQIAEFVLDNPTDVALGTVAEIAERSGVPPSAIVRFAHAIGFDGFTQMQQVFRSRLVAGVAPSYKARLARMKYGKATIAPTSTRPLVWKSTGLCNRNCTPWPAWVVSRNLSR